jgi:histidine triad (HIT) family protein
LCLSQENRPLKVDSMATLFERIESGEIPSQKVFEDALCFVIRDIGPQAPEHLLVIPRKALPRLEMAKEEDTGLLGHLLLVAAEVARREGLNGGYRVVINNGPDGGESVPHLHVHVLGGRALGWPPG